METERKPGDVIIDRYFPDASPEKREEAREQLRAFVRWQMKIVMREVREADGKRRHAQKPLNSN